MSSLLEEFEFRPARCQIIAEIFLIFAVFSLQGAWPVPDVNEPYYLGKAIHYWNPNWGGNDFFFQSKDTNLVFYLLFGWLSLWLKPMVLAWTGRLITWWLLAWSWRRLSFALLRRAWWSILSAALFAILLNHCTMAGEWVIGGVEVKGFAYVFVFLGLEALLRNRWNRAWILFGVASGLHVLVGGWTTVAGGLAWLMLPGTRPSLRRMWPGLLVGLLLALPGLIPALLLNVSTDSTTIQQANLIYVFDRLPHHLYLFKMSLMMIARFLLLASLFFLLCRRISQNYGAVFCPHPMPLSQRARGVVLGRPLTGEIRDSMNFSDFLAVYRFQAFVCGALIIVFCGAFFNVMSMFDRVLAARFMRYYWFRLGDVAVPLGVAILGCEWIIYCLHNRSFVRRMGVFLTGIALLSHFGFLTVERIAPGYPRSERSESPAAWREACVWAQDARHIPHNARFITPRWSQTFKWYSQHAEVATWKDVPQAAADLLEWRR
ncbi:MAG: DUF6798 domain-containing protein, partial [Thermoguttaceae bacterium]